MNIKQTLGVIIYAADYEKLAKWYVDTLGFREVVRLDLPNDQIIGFDMGTNYFSIGKHSEVKDKNKDSCRIMINFNTDSVSKAYKEIKSKGVKIVAAPFLDPTGIVWCMTIKDPENNIIQFFGDK